MKRNRRLALLAVSTLALTAPTVPRAVPGAHAASTPFTIQWTAPGDDSLSGRATYYDLRYSLAPLTSSNFLLGTRITNVPAPATAGTVESFAVQGLTDGLVYYLAIKAGDEVGHWSRMSNVLKRSGATTGVGEPLATLSFSLPRPNPASVSVSWTYSLPVAAVVDVQVFDAVGRHVQTLSSGTHAAGSGDLMWNLRDSGGQKVAPGVYFVRASLGTTQWTRRLVIVR
jgi:hypothetical protein